MTDQSPSIERSRLYKFYRLLVVPALLWYVWVAHYVLTTEVGVTSSYFEWTRFFGVFVASPISILLGFAIMRRLPGNVIGPALIVFACIVPSELTAELLVPTWQGSLNEFALFSFMFPAQFVIATHFPSGKFHPPKVMPLALGLYILIVSFGMVSLIASPISYGTEWSHIEPQPNPFLIEALLPLGEAFDRLLEPILVVTSSSGFLFALYRYFHTTPLERKQMRWLLLVAVPPIVLLMLPQLIEVTDTVKWTSSLSILVAMFSLPVTIAIGILFYGLWDIDVIIRRTLTYAAVSALLAGTYFLIVTLAQSLLSNFFDENNTLLIVLSTLAVAVLFNPVRERVQNAVDRLFYRKRYDAQEILDHFSDHLRGAIEPDAIQAKLMQSVSETIQPQSISLWMVEPAKKS